MPIDPIMINPMLDPYRNMVQECKDKNLKGEDFDKMCDILNQMEDLGKKSDDVVNFSMEMMKKDLYTKFSNYYTNVLTQATKASASSITSDADLLNLTLNAYRDTIKRIKDEKQRALKNANESIELVKARSNEAFKQFAKTNPKLLKNLTEKDKETTYKEIDETLEKKPDAYNSSAEVQALINDELLIKPIEAAIALGEEPGMTTPKFWRLMIESGLDKSMMSPQTVRESMAREAESYDFLYKGTVRAEIAKKKLEIYDQLASKSNINSPNIDELSYALKRLDREFLPIYNKSQQIETRFVDIFDDIFLWALAHCSFAHQIDPWKNYEKPMEMVIFDKKTLPGLIKEKLKLVRKYFNLSFYDLIKTKEVDNLILLNEIKLSQECLEFIITKVFPECLPYKEMSHENITIIERLHNEKLTDNPEDHMPTVRVMQNYDRIYGEGKFLRRFDSPQKNDSKAKPWNLDSFKELVKNL